MKTKSSDLTVLGWQEWLALPDLGIMALKAKIDTGARSSSLHATRMEPFKRNDEQWVRFSVHPETHPPYNTVRVEAPLIGRKDIKSSNGQIETRLIIKTTVRMGNSVWQTDITLTNRSDMRLQMLLGRRSIPKGWHVNPHRLCVMPIPDQ